jgi:hypothetical protein
MKKHLEIKILIACIIFQAISGLAGGIGLITDPTGASLKIPQEWLSQSPFKNYLMPGTILFIVLGIFPTIVSVGLWKGQYWGLIFPTSKKLILSSITTLTIGGIKCITLVSIFINLLLT